MDEEIIIRDAAGCEALIEQLGVNAPDVPKKVVLERAIGPPHQVERLAEALKSNTTLESLTIISNAYESPATSFVAPEGIAALAKALKQNATLREFTLSYNGIDDAGARCIAEALEVNTALKSLDLRNNNISREGEAVIASALRRNNTIQYLWVSDEGIDGIYGPAATYRLQRNRMAQSGGRWAESVQASRAQNKCTIT